jgi:ABC-type Fe3+-siderophore transport system permease subunit
MTVITWRRAVVGASLAAAGLLMVGCSKNDEVTPSTAAEATASNTAAITIRAPPSRYPHMISPREPVSIR